MMEDMYTYMDDYCVCDPKHIYLGTRTSEGDEVNGWPQYVQNVNGDDIGVANNKAEYINVWNSDESNAELGILSGLIGPFSYTLKMFPGKVPPGYVIGNMLAGSMANAILNDPDGEMILNESGEQILYD